MTPTLPHLLAAYGLCFVLVNNKVPWLSNLLRYSPTLDRMLNCSFCTGFHCGWLMWLVVAVWRQMQGEPRPGWEGGPEILLWGFAGAAFCYLVDTAARWLESGAEPSA